MKEKDIIQAVKYVEETEKNIVSRLLLKGSLESNFVKGIYAVLEHKRNALDNKVVIYYKYAVNNYLFESSFEMEDAELNMMLKTNSSSPPSVRIITKEVVTRIVKEISDKLSKEILETAVKNEI